MTPTNLEECLYELSKFPQNLQDLKSKPEEDMIEFHHSVGRWIRNNWGLWTKGPLYYYFLDLGLFHPDDMSSIILTSYHRHLKNIPLRLEEQITKYTTYWENHLLGNHEPNSI